MTSGSIDQEKQAVRERVWTLLSEAKATPPDSYGKIPGFFGAEQTAQRLAELDVWKRARTIKANPDYAQLPVRARALEDDKLLYMAVPKIAGLKPFFRLDPARLDIPTVQAAEKASASANAERVGIDEMTPIDMVICGSVAVNRSGARIGKGAGYSDIEVALLIEAGLVTEETTIVATVHQLQVIDEEIPKTEHDFSVDVIVTPDEVIWCSDRRRPEGIVWDEMPEEKIKAIPVLDAQRRLLCSEESRRTNRPWCSRYKVMAYIRMAADTILAASGVTHVLSYCCIAALRLMSGSRGTC